MDGLAQKRALQGYRARLGERGIARFEVMAPAADRELIRELARRLTEDGPSADAVRNTMRNAVAEKLPERGGILAALRRSPLVGSGINLTRERTNRRPVKF